MKYIIPVLSLLTLAAASAQAAEAAPGLAYNRVGLVYSDALRGYGVQASALIGNSNFLLEASTTIGGGHAGNGEDSASLGYVFKHVALGADAIAYLGSDETYGVAVRKALGADFELQAGYERSSGINLWDLELAYNFNRQYSLALSYIYVSNLPAGLRKHDTQVAVRYSF